MKKKHILLLLQLCLVTISGFCQGGLISTAHSSTVYDAMLDPDGDGYITESGGAFISTTNQESEFEILANSINGWVEIFDVNEANSDITPSCSNVDIVEDADGGGIGWWNMIDPTPLTPRSGDEYLIIRLRMADQYSGNFGYNFLLSTEGLYGSGVDANSVTGNQGFEYEIQFSSGGNKKGVSGWDVDGLVTNGTVNCAACVDLLDVQEANAGVAGGCTAGVPTFITFAFPVSFLPVGLTSAVAPSDLFVGIATAASGNNTSILGGGNVKDYGAFNDNAYPAGCTGTGAALFDCLMETAFSTQQAALPVELLQFEVASQEAGNLLQWKVAAEIDLHGYELEASTEGQTFVTRAFIEARADEQIGVTHYSFFDKNASPLVYYRLRNVDVDGTYKFSNIIVVERAMEKWEIYPNPIKAQQAQYLTVQNVKEGEFILTNILGKRIADYLISNDDTSIRLPMLQSGSYLFIQKETGQKKLILVQ